jgi:hypothetical protein
MFFGFVSAQRRPPAHTPFLSFSSRREHKNKKTDPSSGRILGTAALIVERKFIHGCGKVGHIEDVVVDEKARGGRIGQR